MVLIVVYVIEVAVVESGEVALLLAFQGDASLSVRCAPNQPDRPIIQMLAIGQMTTLLRMVMLPQVRMARLAAAKSAMPIVE